jgi:predicted Zn-dependent peptidase
MYKIRQYPNNVRLIHKKIAGISSAALGLWVNTGSRNESPRINGVSHYLEHLVFKGSKNYTGDQIKESIEGLGGSLNAFTSEENTCYYAKFLGHHLPKVARVLADMVLTPLLKDEDIEKERTVIIEEIKMYKDLPQYQVQEIFDELVWPDHALGRNIAGTVESVSAITRSQITDYHRKWYQPASLVIACAGNYDEKSLEAFAVRAFGRLKAHPADPIEVFTDRTDKPRVKTVSKDIEQTHINLGFPGLSRGHKDRFVLALLQVILGGNMSSRLFNEVREKKGLAYEIGAHVKKLKDSGVFFVHAGIDNKNLVEATRVIFKELKRVKRETVPAAELKRAKDFLIAQTVMALDDSMEHMLWTGDSLTNLDAIMTKEEVCRHIGRATAHDIQRLAQEVIKGHRLRFAAVGPRCHEQEARINELIVDLG